MRLTALHMKTGAKQQFEFNSIWEAQKRNKAFRYWEIIGK